MMNNMPDLKGKKILVLAGNSQHIKMVDSARKMGVYTVVTDYLTPEESPAKKVADEYWMISFADVDALAQKCKEEHIDGIVTCSREATFEPYYKLCKELNLPCYAEWNQFEILMNKKKFKNACVENGVSVIPEFSLKDVEERKVVFPVFVKPADSASSIGISICNNYEELEKGIEFAKSKSPSKQILIEQYFGGKNSFQVTFFFVNGKAYVIRTADGYKGEVEEKLDRVALCSISPSRYTKEYLETTNETFVNMLRTIGVENGPAMVQGFYDNGVFRFYDPGRRFPGTDFEVVYNELFDIDLMQMMIAYAINGIMPEIDISNDNVYLNGKVAALLFPTISCGTVGSVKGYDELKKNNKVRNVRQKYVAGETLDRPNTTLQRIFEIDFVSDSIEDTKEVIHMIQESIQVADEKGNDMIYKPFNTERLS